MSSKIEFKQYWRILDAKQKNNLACNAGTSKAYLSQIAYGQRKAGIDLVARLIKADPRISIHMLRPEYPK